jgi:hypothetical protein
MKLERLDPQDVDWAELDRLPDRLLFQTREWVEFIARTQRAEPVVAAVVDDGRAVGWFTGLVVRRFGLRVLGSPLPGWTTDYMGFNLQPGIDRCAAAAALVRFAFGPLRCVHLEFKDRSFTERDVPGPGFRHTRAMTYEVDLTGSEDEVFSRMSSACRRAIRKAQKSGVTVEAAADRAFAEEYYTQLKDVFAKQALVPTYDLARVQELIRCLAPSGRLLALRARKPDGTTIATGIFPAFGGSAYFWGGASVREHQGLRPNELVFWTAMQYWRSRGVVNLDLGGAGDYKRKYGGRQIWTPWFRISRYPALPALREATRSAVRLRQQLSGRRIERVGRT